MTAFEALAWLEAHGRRLIVQQLQPSARRRKNAIVFEYACPDGNTAVVGGRSVFDAVRKAHARLQTFQMRNDLSIPGAETRCYRR